MLLATKIPVFYPLDFSIFFDNSSYQLAGKSALFVESVSIMPENANLISFTQEA